MYVHILVNTSVYPPIDKPVYELGDDFLNPALYDSFAHLRISADLTHEAVHLALRPLHAVRISRAASLDDSTFTPYPASWTSDPSCPCARATQSHCWWHVLAADSLQAMNVTSHCKKEYR